MGSLKRKYPYAQNGIDYFSLNEYKSLSDSNSFSACVNCSEFIQRNILRCFQSNMCNNADAFITTLQSYLPKMLPETTAKLLHDVAFLNIPRKNGEPIHIGNTALVPKQAQQPVTQNNSSKLLNRPQMSKRIFEINNNSKPSSSSIITNFNDANKLPMKSQRDDANKLPSINRLDYGRKK